MRADGDTVLLLSVILISGVEESRNKGNHYEHWNASPSSVNGQKLIGDRLERGNRHEGVLCGV